MTLKKYAGDLIAKDYKLADVSDESALIEMFIEGVNAFIKLSLSNRSATNSQAFLTSLASQAVSLCSKWIDFGKIRTRNYPNVNSKLPNTRKSWSIVDVASNMSTRKNLNFYSKDEKMQTILAEGNNYRFIYFSVRKWGWTGFLFHQCHLLIHPSSKSVTTLFVLIRSVRSLLWIYLCREQRFVLRICKYLVRHNNRNVPIAITF